MVGFTSSSILTLLRWGTPVLQKRDRWGGALGVEMGALLTISLLG